MQATADSDHYAGGEKSPIVVVGAGQAGARVCLALRAGGHAGPLILLGTEAHAPYERPALSKRLLTDQDGGEPDWVQPVASYAALGVDFRPSTAVVRLHPEQHLVVLEGGAALPYGRLILATGARPRRLPGLEAGPVPLCYLRTLEDARALRVAAAPGSRVVLAGGGLIGLELAAALTVLQCRVTVVEARDQLCARSLSRSVAQYLSRAHRRRGVEVILGRTLDRTETASGQGCAVLDDGRRLEADLVVAAIGVVPNVELAEEAGLAVRDGIVVDEHGRTSSPDIYAIGDATFQVRRERRLESWSNANTQAEAAALHILGKQPTATPPEWFWTDQYNLNVQVVGRAEGEEIWRGAPEADRFTVFHVRDGALLGATAVNTGRDIAQVRRALAGGAAIDVAALADPVRPLCEAFALARGPAVP